MHHPCTQEISELVYQCDRKQSDWCTPDLGIQETHLSHQWFEFELVSWSSPSTPNYKLLMMDAPESTAAVEVDYSTFSLVLIYYYL